MEHGLEAAERRVLEVERVNRDLRADCARAAVLAEQQHAEAFALRREIATLTKACQDRLDALEAASARASHLAQAADDRAVVIAVLQAEIERLTAEPNDGAR